MTGGKSPRDYESVRGVGDVETVGHNPTGVYPWGSKTDTKLWGPGRHDTHLWEGGVSPRLKGVVQQGTHLQKE